MVNFVICGLICGQIDREDPARHFADIGLNSESKSTIIRLDFNSQDDFEHFIHKFIFFWLGLVRLIV